MKGQQGKSVNIQLKSRAGKNIEKHEKLQIYDICIGKSCCRAYAEWSENYHCYRNLKNKNVNIGINFQVPCLLFKI